MLQKDPETKELNSKLTVDIKQKIQQYRAQIEFSHKVKDQDNLFQKIVEDLKAKTIKLPSKQDIIKSYIARVNEHMIKNFDQQESTKSDSSMLSTKMRINSNA